VSQKMNKKKLFSKICVLGLGYIGLPTAAMFASRELSVIGVDINKSTVDTVNLGQIHIVEPGLEEVVHTAVNKGFLYASSVPLAADAFLIAVPTPIQFLDGDEMLPQPDLSYIKAATQSISLVLKKGDLVVLESTSPVGTTEQVAEWLAAARPDLTFPQSHGSASDIRIAYCPERVLPGHVIRELITNDRVIGGMTNACSNLAADLYSILVEGKCHLTNARTAEMTKLTENSCRDVQIAFANELSIICDELDINVWELISLSNRHPRINILNPGPGVGGHCIAVDPWFIISKAPDKSPLIRAARSVNDGKPKWVVNQIDKALLEFLKENPDKSMSDIIVACYGLTFKANIDDLRESPALQITIDVSYSHQGRVLVVEPNIDSLPREISNLELVSKEKAFEMAHIHVLLVDHVEFKKQDIPVGKIVDTRGVWRNVSVSNRSR
jgi:UDP-N-acetyl-D-mannosaminuronic acid dehydrogenase